MAMVRPCWLLSEATVVQLAEILFNTRTFWNSFFSPFFPLRLELWPGFITSILQFEHSILLGLDISHKILRTDTVYDYMNDVYNSGRGNFHDLVTKGLVGEIVLTRYSSFHCG